MTINHEFATSEQEANVYIEANVDNIFHFDVIRKSDSIFMIFYHDNVQTEVDIKIFIEFLEFANRELKSISD